MYLQGLDTTTPSGRAMFQMLGVFAQFERAILVDRTISRARELRATGMSMDRIARELGIGKSVAQRMFQGVAA